MTKLAFAVLIIALNYLAYSLGAMSNMGVDIEQYSLNIFHTYQTQIEDNLSEDQKILLAEHLPIFFSIDYLCRVYKKDGSSAGLAPGQWIEGQENDRIICPGNIQATMIEGTRIRLLRRKEVALEIGSGGIQINFGNSTLSLNANDFSTRLRGESQANLVWFGVLPQNTFLSCVVGAVQNQILHPLDPHDAPGNVILGSTTCELNNQFADSDASTILGDEYVSLAEIIKPASTRIVLNGAKVSTVLDKKHKLYQPLIDARLVVNSAAPNAPAKLAWTSLRSGKKSCVLRKLKNSLVTGKVLDFNSEQMSGEIPLPPGSNQEIFNLTCKVGIERLFTKKISAQI